MDYTEINELLQKFYAGYSTLEEERILEKYFSGTDGDTAFEIDKQFFLSCKKESGPVDFPLEKISLLVKKGIQKARKNENKQKKWKILVSVSGIAAILILGLFILPDQPKVNHFGLSDTYPNPEDARKEAENALLLVSSLMNKGTENLDKLSKMNEGLSRLAPLEKYNRVETMIPFKFTLKTNKQ